VHVLRLRTGEFVDTAQVRPRVGEDGSDYPSDISRSNWRGLAPPERQFDTFKMVSISTISRTLVNRIWRPACVSLYLLANFFFFFGFGSGNSTKDSPIAFQIFSCRIGRLHRAGRRRGGDARILDRRGQW
jgi:hypothetical protein